MAPPPHVHVDRLYAICINLPVSIIEAYDDLAHRTRRPRSALMREDLAAYAQARSQAPQAPAPAPLAPPMTTP